MTNPTSAAMPRARRSASPPRLAASLLAADFARLGEELAAIETAADAVHLDVMDGHFVPNLTFGMPVVRALRKCCRLPFDVHLMIEAPERYIEEFVAAGADWISLHAEATTHLHRALTRVREAGARAGVALNPLTPLVAVEEALPFCDYVLVMSVNPGFGGQRFITTTLDRVRRLRAMIDSAGLAVEIEVDGGVDAGNAAALARAGADILVAGSAIFATGEPQAGIQRLRLALVSEVA